MGHDIFRLRTKLAAAVTVHLEDGEVSDWIPITGVSWQVKRLTSSSGDLRYDQDRAPTETAGYFLCVEDMLSQRHACQSTGQSRIKIIAIAGAIDAEVLQEELL